MTTTTTPDHWGPIEHDLERIWKACHAADHDNEEARLPAPCREFEGRFETVSAYNLSARALERCLVRCSDVFRPVLIGQLALVHHRESGCLLRIGSCDERGRVRRDLQDDEVGYDLRRFRDQQPLLPGIEDELHLFLGLGPTIAKSVRRLSEGDEVTTEQEFAYVESPRPIFLAEYRGVEAVTVLHLAAPAVVTREQAWALASSSSRVKIDLRVA